MVTSFATRGLCKSRAGRRPHPHPTYATIANLFFATSDSNFNEAPCGCLSPRSHWLTKLVVTFKVRANTA